MSYETVLLLKFSPDGAIILAKEGFHNLYTFWTIPILIFSPVQIIMRHPLPLNALGKNMYKAYKASSCKFYMYPTTVCCCRTYFKPVAKYARQLIYISLYTQNWLSIDRDVIFEFTFAPKNTTHHTLLYVIPQEDMNGVCDLLNPV